jgi:hypothetical protein
MSAALCGKGSNPTRWEVGIAAHILMTGGQPIRGPTSRVRRKRTEIVIEIDEVIQLGPDRGRTSRARCATCGSETSIVTSQQAAAAQAMLDAANGAGGLHFLKTPDGRLWVCVNSLD